MEVLLLGVTDKKYIEEQIRIVAAAGRLSRFKGDVLEIYNKLNDKYKNNIKFIDDRVLCKRHFSISEHDYMVFALKDVSPIVEQILIEQRYASFTVKSRREVDFSSAGYYVPDFHDTCGNIMAGNNQLQFIYNEHMKYLFEEYEELIKMGISLEDARYILPYSYNSNIIMGLNAHSLRDLIIDLTKGKNSNIGELREFGEKLYDIMKSRCEYMVPFVDNSDKLNKDHVADYLDQFVDNGEYNILDKPILLSATDNVDDTIFVNAIMRVYGYSYYEAVNFYNNNIKDNDIAKRELMGLINKDKKELAGVNFSFEVPTSLAVLTHFTRHRTVDLLIPDFVPIKDLTKYKVPDSIRNIGYDIDNVFRQNYNIFKSFKEAGVRDEDLVYFYLSGNMLNVVLNMDGKALEHILSLRCCNKTQWETRDISNEMRRLVSEQAPYFSKILGPSCEVDFICHEGDESCGKIEKILARRKIEGK